jgi:hypothetical protein
VSFERFRSLVLNSGRTSGGAGAIVETPVDEAIRPLLTDPPGCALHRQADLRDLAAAIEEAPAVVFDASDQMPPGRDDRIDWSREQIRRCGTM